MTSLTDAVTRHERRICGTIPQVAHQLLQGDLLLNF
jgi:hypothetical protein